MIEDISFLVIQIAERLNCAWARQNEDAYRFEFADGLSLHICKNYKGTLRIGVMLGDMTRLLDYKESLVCAEFKTDKASYIASYIQNQILKPAQEQWMRICRRQLAMQEIENQRRDTAMAIAAQFGGSVIDRQRYDFYRDVELHQYGETRPDDFLLTATYRINQRSVDVIANVTPDIAVWLAYVIRNPAILKEMSEIHAGKFKV